MKKIVSVTLFFYITFFLIVLFLDYSNNNSISLEENKISIIINLPNNLTNEEFIQNLKKIANELNTDIFYLLVDNAGDKVNKKYYTTTYSENFVQIDNIAELLKKYGYLSTIRNNGNITLHGSNFFYDVSIYPFEDIADFNLLSCIYYIDMDKEQAFVDILTDKGYAVKVLESNVIYKEYLSVEYLILPTVLLVVSLIFFGASSAKEVAIHKLCGYSKFMIVIKMCLYDLILVIRIGIVNILISFILMLLFFSQSIFDWIIFITKPICMMAICLMSVFFLIRYIYANINDMLCLKGKKIIQKELYPFTLLFKVIVGIILLFYLNNCVFEIMNLSKVNKINQDISKEMEKYVSLPVNSSASPINEMNQLEYNRRLDLFYSDTVNRYNGIIINTRNFRVVSLFYDDSLAKMYNQRSITVNENYLKINPIYRDDGKVIDGNFLRSDKFNLLIPNDISEEYVIERYENIYGIDEKDINIIIYHKDTKIRTFNPYSGRWDNGLIEKPIIEIYKADILQNQMLNYVSGQYYLLKIDSPNPYEELKPILKKYGLDGIIMQTISVHNVYDNSISNIKNKLIEDIVFAAAFGASWLMMIFLNINCYFLINGKKIVYKKLNGYGIISTYKIPIVLIGLQETILLILSSKFNLLKIIILIAICAEFLLLFLYILMIENLEMKYFIQGEDK